MSLLEASVILVALSEIIVSATMALSEIIVSAAMAAMAVLVSVLEIVVVSVATTSTAVLLGSIYMRMLVMVNSTVVSSEAS